MQISQVSLLDTFVSFLETFDNLLWGYVVLPLLIGMGLYLQLQIPIHASTQISFYRQKLRQYPHSKT